MATVPEMIPLSDLGPGAAGVLKGLRESNQLLAIAEEGREVAVLMSSETYRRLEYERGLLLALLEGERDIACGRTHDIDSVFAEADAILAKDRP